MGDRLITHDLYEDQTGGYPVNQVIVTEGPIVRAFLVDAEFDVYQVFFEPGGEVRFDTRGVNYFVSDTAQLQKIVDMSIEAEALHDEMDEMRDEETGEIVGYEHLVYQRKSKYVAPPR